MKTLALLSAAHIHTPNFIKLMNEDERINVKYVWDDDEARGQKAAAAASASFTSSLTNILADDAIDAVIICSETHKHEALVTKAAAAKKDMFVEKPLGFAKADAHRMAKLIEEAGVLFQTGFFMRGWPYHRFLKEQIKKGHFGTISRVRHSNCHSGALGGWFDSEWRWMADPSQAGCGAFGDLGAHSLDMLIWLMGDVEEVSASIMSVTERYENCDETGEALLKFKNGTIGTLAAGWVDVAHPFRLQISGTEGHALVLGDDLYFQSAHVEGSDIKKIWTDLPDAQPHAFQQFLNALNGQEVVLVSADETAYRNTVMEAIYQAAEQKTWLKVES